MCEATRQRPVFACLIIKQDVILRPRVSLYRLLDLSQRLLNIGFYLFSRSATKGARAPKRSPTIPDQLSITGDASGTLSPSSPITPGGSPGSRSPVPRHSDLERERQGPPPLYLSQPFVKAALVKGNFKTIVMLPKWVDVNEWVAINSAYALRSNG